MIAHVEDSIQRAILGASVLSPQVLKIRGFATRTQRHLVNNLCRPPVKRYLEVGMFAGATSVAAMYGNPHLEFYGIDNFSQDFGTSTIEQEFDENISLFTEPSAAFSTCKDDCFEVAKRTQFANPFDFYYYDGNHSREDQARALPAFFEHMAQQFIFMVDDTNWPFVKEGTKQGMEELKDRILIEKMWNLTGDQPENDVVWHNGILIFVISKR